MRKNTWGEIIILAGLGLFCLVSFIVLGHKQEHLPGSDPYGVPSPTAEQVPTLPTEVQKVYEVQGAYGDIQY